MRGLGAGLYRYPPLRKNTDTDTDTATPGDGSAQATPSLCRVLRKSVSMMIPNDTDDTATTEGGYRWSLALDKFPQFAIVVIRAQRVDRLGDG